MFTEIEATDAVGQPMVLAETAWSPGVVERLGGVACLWTTSETYMGANLWVWVYPTDVARVVADDPNLNGCTSSNGPGLCSATRAVGDAWVSVRTSFSSESSADTTQTVGETVLAKVVERASQIPAPYPAERSQNWWSAKSCADVIARLAALRAVPEGAVESTIHRYQDGYAQESIPTRHGVVLSCNVWADGAPITTFIIWPGAGQRFAEIASLETASPLLIDGAVEAALAPSLDVWEGHYPIIVASDGPNLVGVPVGGTDGPQQHELAMASSLLVALAPTAG